jgi:hypothetical protein
VLHCRRSYRALEHLQGVCGAGARVPRAVRGGSGGRGGGSCARRDLRQRTGPDGRKDASQPTDADFFLQVWIPVTAAAKSNLGCQIILRTLQM